MTEKSIYNPEINIYEKSKAVWQWVHENGDAWKTVDTKELAKQLNLSITTVETHMLWAVKYQHELTIEEIKEIRRTQ